MPIIGNASTARIALDIHNGFHNSGWEKVGQGAFRTCWLHVASNVVYKVQHADWSADHTNAVELRNARNLLRRCMSNDQWINPHVRIPLTSGFHVGRCKELVVAMQYVKGRSGMDTYVSNSARQALFSLSFGDMHPFNYIVDADGTVWPVDMGSPRPGHPKFEQADRRCLSQF